MTFCHSPWTNVDISPRGYISPCCKFKHSFYNDPALSVDSATLKEYQNSNTLQIVRRDFEQDQWPTGCEQCRIEEINGVKSKRILDRERWQEHYDQYDRSSDDILTASIAFGNTCNLSCVTCGPHASSRWQKDYKTLFGLDIRPTHFYRQGFVDAFLAMVPGLIHLDIPGGEPFLSATETQKDLLKKLQQSGRSQEISLHYTTNATIFPDDTWWELWQGFREIDMQLSIDGTESRFEYIRYPAHWAEVLANVRRYQDRAKNHGNLRLSLSHTVSAYSIFYLGEFAVWCNQQSLPEPWLGKVHNPSYLRPTVWPAKVRKQMAAKLEKFGNPLLKSWISILSTVDDSQEWNQFKTVTDRLDSIRGLSFSDTFPEMMEFYKKNTYR